MKTVMNVIVLILFVMLFIFEAMAERQCKDYDETPWFWFFLCGRAVTLIVFIKMFEQFL